MYCIFIHEAYAWESALTNASHGFKRQLPELVSWWRPDRIHYGQYCEFAKTRKVVNENGLGILTRMKASRKKCSGL